MKGKNVRYETRKRQRVIEVTEDTELLKFLIEKMPDNSRNNIKDLLGKEHIEIDGKIVTKFDFKLKKGKKVIINYEKKYLNEDLKGLKIIYEDKYLIVIDKEAGLLTIATEKEEEKTAYSMLTDHVRKVKPLNRIFILHRLDRETSGVMMFAKDAEVQERLRQNWQEDVTERCYLALVEGKVEKESDTITSWLKENRNMVMYSSNKPEDGQKAVTEYKVIKRGTENTLLEVQLETGRKNQIRVHMKDIGHSIVGDKKYGAATNPIGRLGLHAHILEFIHPVTGKEMRFETEIPPAFLKLVN